MPDSPAAAVDPALCPLCGQSNGCAMQTQRLTGQAQPPCWCTRASFSGELLASLPEDCVGRACICSACAAAPPMPKAPAAGRTGPE